MVSLTIFQALTANVESSRFASAFFLTFLQLIPEQDVSSPFFHFHISSADLSPALLDASPSSHAQFFGFFFTFLQLHLFFVQRAPARWSEAKQATWSTKRLIVVAGVGAWSFAVAFSRYVVALQSLSPPIAMNSLSRPSTHRLVADGISPTTPLARSSSAGL